MAIQPGQKEIAIKVQNMVKYYPKASVRAVDDISFTVPRGEIFGLLGPNGAGKTTTIGVLTTSMRPTSGKTFINGIDVAAHPMAIKQRIAVVPQQNNLDRSLRAREILTFHACYHSIPRSERNARADTLLNELGLGNRGKEKVLHYSGGMAQRLMLARAMMHSPDVLFLDEPTNNLDPQSRLFLWERIDALRQREITILLTTHDMQEADQLCERIAIMNAGKILVLDASSETQETDAWRLFLEMRVSIPDHTLPGTGLVSAKIRLLEALRVISPTAKVEEIKDSQQESKVTIFRIYDQVAATLTGEVALTVAHSGAEILDMHVAIPSLEDVFIYLTGRNLR